MELSVKNRQDLQVATLPPVMLEKMIDMELFVIRNLKATQTLRAVMNSSKREFIIKMRTKSLSISKRSTS
jgi:uncharacterized protein YfeS